MRKRLMMLLGLLLAFSLIAAACGDDDDDTSAGGDDGTTEPSDDGTEEPSDDGTEEPSDDGTAEPTDDGTEEPSDDGTEEPSDDGDEPMMDGSDTTIGLVFDTTGRGDQSFNDSAASGVDRAVEDFGISFNEATPNPDGSNRPELLQLAAENSNLVFGVGFLFAESIGTVAENNPDTNFAGIDVFVPDAPDNLAQISFAEEQGSFLVGVAAALKSETGNVGFIGGVNIGLIQKFQAGFEAGVAAVDPSITVQVQYISEPPDDSGFGDPASARVIATSMYESGADVIYHAAGGSGGGLFEAAREYSEAEGSKVWAIGVDSDQYLTADPEVQEYILTSMLKRVDNAVYATIEAQVAGEFVGGFTAFDLESGGIDVSTSGGFIDDILPQIEDYKAQIIAGDIVVPAEL
ncbi:MAG: BMP family ABC transporter substrate-binding protein [Acidimicrobiales bacterium]